MKHIRQPIPTRDEVLAFQSVPPHKATCHYCGRMTFAESAASAMAADRACARRTRDHIKPRAHGGGGTRTVIACAGCNEMKGDTPYAAFKCFADANRARLAEMDENSRGRVVKDYRGFIHQLIQVGFVCARAIALSARRQAAQGAPVTRAPNGRFTKRDLRRLA